jgi:hypothetical protein
MTTAISKMRRLVPAFIVQVHTLLALMATSVKGGEKNKKKWRKITRDVGMSARNAFCMFCSN